MAHIVADRVKDTSTTTGTGALTLANSAPNAYRTFGSVCANNDTCLYGIEHQSANEWEVGVGTYSTTGPALTRTTVIASSNSNAAVNLSAGTKNVWINSPAGVQGWGILAPAQITANQNDYNPTGIGFANILQLTSDQTRRITGIAGGFQGRRLEIQNANTASDGDLIFNYQDTASVAANRFKVDNDILLEPGEGMVLTHDGVQWSCSAIRRKYTGTTFRHTPFYVTDFLGGSTADTGESTYAIWDLALISSGTQSKTNAEPNHPGILRISSSATANSGASIVSGLTSFRIGGGEVAEFVFKPVDLTTVTLRMGYLDTVSSADVTDGCYLELSSSGAIVGKTASNSTRTTSATITTLTANTWYRGRIVVNRAATAVDFYVFDDNGNLLGSQQNTANIPTAAGRETGHGVVGTKSGTTAQAIVDLDYMSMEWTRALI